MLSIVHEAYYSKMEVQKKNERNTTERIGILEVPPLKNFPQTMVPKSLKITYEIPLGLEEKKIIHLVQNVKFSFWGRPKARVAIQDCPVQLLSYKQSQSEYWVRILQSSQESADMNHVRKKTEFLVKVLHVCHLNVLEQMGSLDIQTPFSNQQASFFQWCHKILFDHDKESFPIFGKLKLELSDEQKKDGLLSSVFGPAQKCLLEYLSDSKSAPRTVQVALAVIGYWYINSREDYLIKYFGSHQQYWVVMENILKENLTKGWRKDFTLAGYCTTAQSK